jgi:uncharacterized protein (TIGR02145 family)
MQYSTTPGAVGICLPIEGWHVPTDEEWKILEGNTDIQFGVGDDEWDGQGWRGDDAGHHIKSTSGWAAGGNGDDFYGFSALAAGRRVDDRNFYNMESNADFWSSTNYDSSNAWYRRLFWMYNTVLRDPHSKNNGFSVRCLLDE